MILFIFSFIHDDRFFKERKVAYFGARRPIELSLENQFFTFNSG